MDPLQNKRTASLQNSDPTSHQYKNTSGQTKSTHKRHDHPRLPGVPKSCYDSDESKAMLPYKNGSFLQIAWSNSHKGIDSYRKAFQKKNKTATCDHHLSQKWIPIVPTPRCGFCARWSHGTRLGSLEKKQQL